jgi:hypothetical protein
VIIGTPAAIAANSGRLTTSLSAIDSTPPRTIASADGWA